MNTQGRIALALSLAALVGCETTKPLYHYGSYPNHVYEHFKNEDTAITQQIDDLEKTIAETTTRRLKVAPGIYAHLGFLYLQSGQIDSGLQHLVQEKTLYPESTKYIDFLLNNAKAVN